MNRFIPSIAIVLTLLFAGCNTGKTGSSGVAIKSSESYEATIYRQNCAICHGPEGYGKTSNGVKIPSLRSGEPATRSENQIYEQIANGKLPMPSFKGQLTEQEMRKMARFVKEEIQGRKD